MHLAAPLERRRPFTTSGNKCPQAHGVLSKLATNLTFLTYPARRFDLTRFSVKMAVMMGLEPTLFDVTDRCFNQLNYTTINYSRREFETRMKT